MYIHTCIYKYMHDVHVLAERITFVVTNTELICLESTNKYLAVTVRGHGIFLQKCSHLHAIKQGSLELNAQKVLATMLGWKTAFQFARDAHSLLWGPESVVA